MTYSKSNTEKYTLIDDLLDLDNEENNQANKIKDKYIRNNSTKSKYSELKENYSDTTNYTPIQTQNHQTPPIQNQQIQQYENHQTQQIQKYENHQTQPYENHQTQPYENHQTQQIQKYENQIQEYQQQNSYNQNQTNQQNQQNQNYYKPYNNHKQYYNDDSYQDDNKLPYYNNYHNIPSNSPYSCLDISSHIENCPICSKFYNTDKTIYVITIVILIIFCIILIKKIIDK